MMIFAFKHLLVSHAFRVNPSVSLNKYGTLGITKLSIMKIGPGSRWAPFSSGLHRVKDHKIVHNQERAGHPVGCISPTTAEKHQVRQLFQETFTYASEDHSLRDDSLGGLDYSTSGHLWRNFSIKRPGKSLNYRLFWGHFSMNQPSNSLN